MAWIALGWGLLAVGCSESPVDEAAPTESFVCGVDGKTYALEDVERDDTEVLHRGRCDEPMRCEAGDDCFAGDTCLWASGETWCVPQPTSCVCIGVFEPVCGVDGRNYVNACEAECADVRVRHEGYCEDPPDPCALIDCEQGFICVEGKCVPEECPVETHIVDDDGNCVPKCYGPEQCSDDQSCNALDVCKLDPACPECDVCVGWCVPPVGDCRIDGCEDDWTCDYCRTSDGGAEWICLSPLAGACEPPNDCVETGCNGEICAEAPVASPCVALPEFACYREVGICERQPWGGCGWTPTPELDECLADFDCRATGCKEGTYCGSCWSWWECIPEGSAC